MVSVYPAILTTHIRLLEQCSQTVTSREHLLSLFISEIHRSAITLVKSAKSCPGWELACTLCMPPSLEALVKGDYSELDDDICEADLEENYNLFAEGEEDDGACFVLTDHFR